MSQEEWEELVARHEGVSEEQRRKTGSGCGGCIAGLVYLSISFAAFVGLVWVALQILGR